MGIGLDVLIKPEIVGKRGRAEQFAAEVRKRIEHRFSGELPECMGGSLGALNIMVTSNTANMADVRVTGDKNTNAAIIKSIITSEIDDLARNGSW
ncbi:Uncharacterised protein [Klebsiella variicola]|uniref:hypothetical protein n=1 Tax=Klebsiella variicola TaxID=244366 RepID=UPI000E2C8DE0|nr:hypothetical protein [Klebsiella variicola]SXE50819.1 Uncharacterised protein [Klebsiella variicola]